LPLDFNDAVERRAGQVNSRLAQWLTDFVFELAERSEPRLKSRGFLQFLFTFCVWEQLGSILLAILPSTPPPISLWFIL